LKKEHPISVHEGQTHFGMSRDAEMRLALNEPNRLLFIQIQTIHPDMHHSCKEIIDIMRKMRNAKIIGDPTPNKKVPLSSRITLVSKQESHHYLAYLKQGHYGLTVKLSSLEAQT
jgi:hypothetical protein